MAETAPRNGTVTPIHAISRGKNMIYYTVPEHADTLLIPIKAKKDSDRARRKAIEEILRRMNDEDDATLEADSFMDGLDVSKLVVVEEPELKIEKKKKAKRSKSSSKQDGDADSFDGSDGDLSEIEIAAADLARFSLVRVKFQEHQEAAQEYLPLIEALFSEAPLDEDQIKAAKNKAFPRTLTRLAGAKIEFDGFHNRAQDAWTMLKPLIIGARRAGDTEENPFED